MRAKRTDLDQLARRLRAYGMRFPGVHTKSPWPDHDDLAVRDKTFVYLSAPGEPLSIACKLPETSAIALTYACAKPTAYGLGRSGWVTFTPTETDCPAAEEFERWIEESYRAQAPRTFKQLA
jgi:predicted DNA-binding protein (MmcQ/YjbR family)